MEKFALTPSFMKRGGDIPEKNDGSEVSPFNGENESASAVHSSDVSNVGGTSENTLAESEEVGGNGENKEGEVAEENDEKSKEKIARNSDNVEAALSFMRAHEARTRRILDNNKKPPFSH